MLALQSMQLKLGCSSEKKDGGPKVQNDSKLRVWKDGTPPPCQWTSHANGPPLSKEETWPPLLMAPPS